MEAPDARKIIAAYLSGHEVVTREELDKACEAIKSDELYLGYLREELGLGDDWVILCDVFAERAAEFCEMTERERGDEMPDLVNHLGTCGSCRSLYWEISPLWREQAGTAAISFIRELGGQIRLLIGKTGWMREQGPGPPSLHFAPAAPTLSGPEDELPDLPGAEKRKQWSFGDEEADCDLKIAVEGQAGGGANVSCSMQAGPSKKVSAEQTRIEVRDAVTGSLLLAGRLSDIEAEPINLAPGSWLIHLVAKSGDGSFAWGIPLELRAEK